MTYRNNWAEDYVYYKDSRGKLRCLPAKWTDIGPQDPFVVFSQGRSYFRVEDLLELTRQIQNLQGISRKNKNVKKNTP